MSYRATWGSTRVIQETGGMSGKHAFIVDLWEGMDQAW